MSYETGRKFKLQRTHVVFIAIVGVAVLIAFFGGRTTAPKALGGEYENIALVEIKGEVKHLALFCIDTDCKWIAAIDVKESNKVKEGPVALTVPAIGDVQTVDMRDSRVNLWVEQKTRECTEDAGVKVCEYKLREDMKNIVYVYREIIGSSGLPEYDATPR